MDEKAVIFDFPYTTGKWEYCRGKKSSGQDYKMQKLLLKVNMNFFAYYAMTNKLSWNLLRNKFCIGIEV